jgi:hypothetical protein
MGGTQSEAIGALLHDAFEDGGGPPMLENIRQAFGDDVARIVEANSDTPVEPKPWQQSLAVDVSRSCGPLIRIRKGSCSGSVPVARPAPLLPSRPAQSLGYRSTNANSSATSTDTTGSASAWIVLPGR